MKKFFVFLILSLFISPLTFGQSRAPAVEPQRGLSIDRGPEYKNHPGFQFKNGKPVSTSEQMPQGNGVYAVLFMMALASMPFIMHVIFRGNVVPQADEAQSEQTSTTVHDSATTTEPGVSSLQEFRDKKTTDDDSATTEDDDIKKAS